MTRSTKQAEVIINKYGKLLSATKPSIYGAPISQLPYSKEQIKVAIQTIILSLEEKDPNIEESLTQAYVFLAQFIDDDQAEIAKKGQAILEKETGEKDIDDLELANQAVQTINKIKSDMENLMAEIRLLLP